MELNLHGGNGTDRRKLDHYDTPVEVTIALLEFLKLKPCMVWEPACGNNAIVDILRVYGHEVIATDIATGKDYLQVPGKADAIITNPPFYCSSQFIEKALTEAPVVAMLLKSQYWHSRSRLQLFMQHKPTWILPLTWRPDFIQLKGGHPTMEVIWSVWNSGEQFEHTCYLPLMKPKLDKQIDLFSNHHI